MRRFVVLTLGLLPAVVLVSVVPAGVAGAKPGAARVKGRFSGSGSSALDFVEGRPVLRATSSGQFRSNRLGSGTYSLQITTLGGLEYVSMTVSSPRGSLTVGDGPIAPEDLAVTALPVRGGTGGFASSTGSLTLVTYARTGVTCTPSPPAPLPDTACSWHESGTVRGLVRLRG